MSKCLVTGGAGFIGSHVVDALIEQGHEVTVLDNCSTGKEENLNINATNIPGDICHQYTFDLEKHDYVFHLAALARIPRSIEDPVGTNAVNVNGTLNVLEYCRKHKAKLIFSSSSSIYEEGNLPTSEDSPISPLNPYALQKYIGEQWIKIYKELYGVESCILRYFNVYGERQITEGAYAAVVGIFLQQKKEGKDLTITNDGEQRRDFTYVKDVVKANLMAMNWDGVYNVGNGDNRSVNEIAKAVGGNIKYIGNTFGQVKETLADNLEAKLKGWFPTTNIEDWINETQR